MSWRLYHINHIFRDPNKMKYMVLFCTSLEYLWETYLAMRQYRITHKTVEVPPELRTSMSKEVFDKSRLYSLARLKYGLVQDAVSFGATITVFCSPILSKVWYYAHKINPVPGEVTTSCIWLLILSTISTIISLPLTAYATFFLEERFGFNKQTVGFFIWDNIKFFILSQVLMLGASSIIIVIVKNGGDYFFVWLWTGLCVLSLALIIIFPSLIAPLFDKYTPLPEGELRTQIEALAQQLEFPLAQLYVVEGSKRSSHSNAYFYGIFKEKRIVLFDTLLKKDDGSGCTNEEVLAVLSHELGHWYHNHMLKGLTVMELDILLKILFFALMFKKPVLYEVVGFYEYQPVLVGFLVLLQYVMLPYNTILSFIMTFVSRKFEYQADAFAVSLGKSEALRTGLLQIYNDNLIFPIYDPLYSTWHHSHPTLLERIKELKTHKKD